MRQEVQIFFFLVLVCGHVHSNERIAGGQNAADGGHPYTVSVRYVHPDTHVCGGIIVAKRTILTAAQCLFQSSVANTVIVAGTNLWNTGGTRYTPARFIIHPSFDENTVKNDIGLIIVNRDIDYTNKVMMIETSAEVIPAADTVNVMGWGSSEEEGPMSASLKRLTTTTITNADCKSRVGTFGSFVLDTNLCINHPNGQGTCDGDSGGPVVKNDKLVGVVSWVPSCGKGAPSVNSRISSFKAWIDTNKV